MDWHEFLEQGGQHTLLTLSIILTSFGIAAYLRKEKQRRLDLLIAQQEQTRLLKRIDRELHPKNGDNGGPTAVDVLSQSIKANSDAIARLHEDNERAHQDIHRRIDGFFEAIGIGNNQKKIAGRHHQSREDEDG